MTYLLDVNALVALGFLQHPFHRRVAEWLQAQGFPPLATCSITELGFLRVLTQVSAYGFTMDQAQTLLQRLKRSRSLGFTFVPDDHDVSHLPRWVEAPKHITDGHLAQLATANQMTLATLDEKIPGSYLIP